MINISDNWQNIQIIFQQPVTDGSAQFLRMLILPPGGSGALLNFHPGENNASNAGLRLDFIHNFLAAPIVGAQNFVVTISNWSATKKSYFYHMPKYAISWLRCVSGQVEFVRKNAMKYWGE